jgi:hypothetical protein
MNEMGKLIMGGFLPEGVEVCEKCGVLMRPADEKPHYVNGHLQCRCGKNIDECCQMETANELHS